MKVNKVSFKKVNDKKISYDDIEILELYPDFYELLEIINNIESYNNFGKRIHIEAFTGIDYLGNKVSYDAYLVYTDTKLYKYNFNSDLIPFNREILVRKRDKNINKLL